MIEQYRIYCDESCHLENDRQKVMLLGCVWTPEQHVKRLSRELRDIKKRHHADGELKWTKVSNSRLNFFLEVVEWFFAEEPLHFRCLIVPDKTVLDHAAFNQGSHDDFYYKMYFSLLSKIISPNRLYDIYLDIKDTRSNFKVRLLREILCNDRYDFTHEMIRRVQHVRSGESEILQLADLLLGAVAYKHRGLNTSLIKLKLIEAIEKHHNRSLLLSTSAPMFGDNKFNIFVWRPRPVTEIK